MSIELVGFGIVLLCDIAMLVMAAIVVGRQILSRKLK